MKLAALVLTLSAFALDASRADDANTRSLQFAQMTQSKPEHQPAGACTPIGLTANGEIVFPWECREIIEKQRGPVSVSLPTAPNDPLVKDQPASPHARPEDAVGTSAPAQPVVATTTDRALSPPDASVAPAPGVPVLHRRRSSAVRLKEQPLATQPRPASGAVVKPSNKDDKDNKDKVALQQRGAPQR
jgi:hypothetical protein